MKMLWNFNVNMHDIPDVQSPCDRTTLIHFLPVSHMPFIKHQSHKSGKVLIQYNTFTGTFNVPQTTCSEILWTNKDSVRNMSVLLGLWVFVCV